MATIYTEYQNVDHFFAFVDSGGPNFNGFDEAVFGPMDQFLGSTRTFDAAIPTFDQTAQHRTGFTSHGGPPEGNFVIVGSGLGGSSLTVNAVVLEQMGGGSFLMTSTAGATMPVAGDNITGGSINHLRFETGTPGEDGHFLYDLNGALSFSAGTLTVSSIHIEQTFDAGGLVTVSGTLLGNFKFGDVNPNPEIEETGILSGTITALSLDIDGTRLEASGFSISAVTFFHAQTSDDYGTVLSLIGAGNDVITGGGTIGQVLNGYAGNDVLIAGAESTTFIGGTGNDIFDFNGHGGSIIIENEGAAGGIDTVRTNMTFSLGGIVVERLVLTGDSSIDGTGNDLANLITGNSNTNILDGGLLADTMIGGGGDDTFYADNVGDKFGAEAADSSFDTIYSSVNQILGANFEALYLGGDATIGTGNNLANLIYGNGIASVLTGMGGDDEIHGGSANDKIEGGDGNDDILGGAGANTILGGAGDDSISGGDINDTDSDKVDAGAGNDSVDGGEGADSLAGGTGADSLYGGTGNDNIAGGDGNDLIYGGDGNDYVDGGGGNDTIYAGSLGTDVNTLIGGAGNDIFYTDLFADSIVGGAGIDKITETAGGGTITLEATTENLAFTNDAGSTGIGNALANVFTSGEGTDSFDGKGGNDTYNLSGGDSASEDSSGGGIDLVIYQGSGTTFTLGSGIDNLILVGDSLAGAGNTLNNVLTSGEGSQQFDGKTGNDTYNVQADDSVNENDEGDGGGNDLVIATLTDGQEFDLGTFIERLTLVHVGEGTIYAYGNGLDNVITGANNADNALHDSDGADTLIGGAGNDGLYGGNGADSLLGGAGNDWLDGGNDAGNTLVGGAGDDDFVRYLQNTLGTTTLMGSTMTDTGGSDTVWFSAGGDSNDSVFNLNLATQAGFGMIDNLNAGEAGGFGMRFNFTGNAGNNRLEGADGADTLNGGAGNDWLDGGAGADSLIGGLGDDSYVLSLINTVHLFEGTPTGFADISLNVSEVSDAGGNDTLVLVGGGGLPEFAPFAYDIGANTQNPFENVDASGVSTSLNFNLAGNDAGNRLIGNLAADTMGADTLTGGLGNDTYGVNVGDVVVETDTLSGNGHRDLVIANLLDGETLNLAGEGYENIEDLTLVDIGIETTLHGWGNARANKIIGDSHADNDLSGGAGNGDADTLIGGAGDDTLDGLSGADSLVGGLGDDLFITDLKALAAGAIEDAVSDAGGIDSLEVNGNETVQTLTLALSGTLAAFENLDISGVGGTVNATLTGNAAGNTIIGNDGNNKIDGKEGDDSLWGGLGSDTLLGGAGADTLNGGVDISDNDFLDGGLGDDLYIDSGGNQTFIIAQAGDNATGGLGGGNDTVIVSVAGGHGLLNLNGENSFLENAKFTGTGSVQIIGNGEDNILTGNAGADTIYGGAYDSGNGDVLDGGAGNDLLDGGEGADTITGGTGDDSMQGGYAQTPGNGWSDGGDSMTGNAGNDTLDGGEGGADTLLGGDGNDSLYGGADNGGAGFSNDVLSGGAGNDTLDGGQGADTLDGGAGNDSLYGNEGADSLSGGDGADTIIGGNGADSMLGGAGNDVFDNPSMSGGADTMVGGAGDDTYTVNESDDVVTELSGGGTDTVFSDAESFTLGANIERLTIRYGEDGTGNLGANIITGNDGGNVLAGGGGNDTVTGGDGGDYFYLANVTAGNVMAIQDFDQAEGDRLMLDPTAFAAVMGPIPEDVVTNGLAATAGHAQFIYTYGTGSSIGSLYYDADGTGLQAKVLVATFAAGTKPVELTSSDFTGPV